MEIIVTLHGLTESRGRCDTVGPRGSCGTMELWQLWYHGTKEMIVKPMDPMELKIQVMVWGKWNRGAIVTLWGLVQPRREL